jgi:proteic killer suppression protein
MSIGNLPKEGSGNCREIPGLAPNARCPLQERSLMKLQQLHAAEDLEDLLIPVSNQLEVLKGDRKGQCSIRVNKQWRICFKWNAGHVSDVEITDYH